tara:strand:- start:135 stop:1757 length:1623 start_codon:yes stop_codon:yes gene_type:complete
MPTPRAHGGAPLTLIPLNLPGFQGLNKQADSTLLGPEWATTLQNAVIDENNRLAARKGWVNKTTTALPGPILVAITFYNTVTSEEEYVVSIDVDTSTTLYASNDGGITFRDVTGTANVADPNMQLLPLNGKLFGIQQGGGAMIMYDGTSFVDVADVNAPNGPVGLAAYGRLWVVDEDGVTVKYSSLLDGTDWTPVTTPGAADPGQISVGNVWAGDDRVTALVSFNGRLVVFGVHHIIVWEDPQGSELGLNPLNISVADTLRGIGCVWRDLIQNVQGDLWFVSLQGLHSFSRLIQEKSNPLENIAPQMQDYITSKMSDPGIDLKRARSFYSPLDRFFLLSLPKASIASGSSTITDYGSTMCFDTRSQLSGGSVRCTGVWDWMVPQAGLLNKVTGELTLAVNNAPGKLGVYTGYLDDESDYNFDYESGWMDVTKQGYKIIPKRIDSILYIDSAAAVNFKWFFDFTGTPHSRAVTYPSPGVLAEYNVSEFGIAEYDGGLSLRTSKVAASGTGEYIKLGCATVVAGSTISIQKLDLFVKVGRLN